MSFEYLGDGHGLRFNEAACLPLRSLYGECRACASVCPRGVLRVSIESVELADGCIECGRCVAACPTAALALDQVGALTPPSGPASVRIECSRVPADRLSADTVRVPCCGSISVGRLLELAATCPDVSVTMVDRGWCRSCNAGGGDEHPARWAVDEAALWLESVGVSPEARPKIDLDPLSIDEMFVESRPARDRAMTRRQFFQRILERPLEPDHAQASSADSGGRPQHPASERGRSPERQRRLDALDRLAARAGHETPVEFFAQVVQDGRCADHRICVALCPTGALTIDSDSEFAVLLLDGGACIGCGACARACPEKALIVEPHGGERGITEITRHLWRACEECGAEFTSADHDELLCTSCRKSKQFVASIFGVRA